MIWQDWVTGHEDIREVSQVWSSWLKGRDLKVSPEAFQALWCHNNVLAGFFLIFFGRDGYSLHKCNDSNLKSM